MSNKKKTFSAHKITLSKISHKVEMKRKHLAFGCKSQRKNSSKLNPLHSKSSFKHASLSGAPALGGSCWLLERDRLTWARKKHYTATRLSKEVTKVLKAHSLGHRSPWRAGCIAQKELSALVRHISPGTVYCSRNSHSPYFQ